MAITYTDEYLASEVTPPREARATADVDAVMTFTEAWRERLIELRTYIITCQECMRGTTEDLFYAKLKAYRDEYESAMITAKAAAREAEMTTAPILSIRIERA